MKLVVVTQKVDPADPNLGATVAKLRALAGRVDELVVLADSAVDGVLPENARVRLFASPSRAARGVRFEAALAAELARRRPAAVLAHMCPIYAVLAAPLARPLGVRVLLWFTHWRASRLLQLAERVSTTVVSVDRGSFPLDSRKLVATGHGIDLSEFGCVARSDDGGDLRLVALGRTSPAKGLAVVVRAAARVPEALLAVVGPSLTEEERRHRAELEALVAELGVPDRVSIEEALPRERVPERLAAADALVNNMRAGAPDKIVYEAAATCLPVLASNPVFAGFLPDSLRFPREDVDALAERIRGLRRLDRAAIGRDLRERVVREHSVETWADRIVELANQ